MAASLTAGAAPLAGPREGGQVLDPAQAAACPPGHDTPPRQQAMETRRRQVQDQPHSFLRLFDRNAVDVLPRGDRSFGQAEPGGEVLQVGWRQHHHGIRQGAIDDVDRHLDRNGTGGGGGEVSR
jgi:hypothetical protein